MGRNQYVAFLRAINVGGRVVKMPEIQAVFESLGLAEVSTFLASGNVLFQSSRRSPAALEAEIEARLESVLGYTVATLLRTPEELVAILRHEPFPRAEIEAPGNTLYITLLKTALGEEAQRLLPTFETPTDRLASLGREVYRLSLGKVSESKLPEGPVARALGVPGTARNRNTIERLVAKLAGGANSTARRAPRKPRGGS